IEKDEKNPLIEQCRNQGAIVLVGDATNRNLLHKAGVKKAKYLIIVCTDDGTNAQIALKARYVVHFRKGGALTAFVSIVDLELCNLLGGGELVASEAYTFRLEFFNILERGVHLMLSEYSPLEYVVEAIDKQPHILLIGLGKMGRSLLVQMARNWWMKYEKSGTRLRISVVDKAAKAKVELLRLRYPQLNKICEFDIWQMENNTPEFERGDFLFDSEGRCDVDIIYICFDDDAHVLVSALTLHRKTKQQKVPIVLRMNQDAGLSALLKEDRVTLDFNQIHVFSLLDRTCSLEALLGGMHEILARAIHEDYVSRQKEAGETPQTNPSMVDWDGLLEDLKESNRHQADHIVAKLKAIDCGLHPLTDWEAASFKFLPEEFELLSEMEHGRWCEERLYQGWTYAPGPKDAKKKTSPHLVSWEELSEEIKEYDRNMVEGLPSFLAKAGLQIYRRT
ncbi:MAG: RyR domain-containing protein, partial [Actinobacteria bacterium]|nr:RyR domain-containing protein [Actinomycetota bacterium]